MRFVLLLLLTTSCSRLFGFEAPTVADSAIAPPIDGDPPQQCVVGGTDCTSATPICDDGQCRGCTSHDECSSEACMPDGSCADEEDVAYAAPGGSGPDCRKASPCSSVRDAAETGRPVVKISGTIAELIKVPVSSGTVVFLADPGAKLTRAGGNGGPIFSVEGGTVTIVGLEISNTTNGISSIEQTGGSLFLDRVTVRDTQGRGLDAQDATELGISRSVFVNNKLGGANITDVRIAISNSLFVQNGTTTSTIGGLRVIGAEPGSRFELNTVADNVTDAANSANAGVNCGGTPFVANSNIVAGAGGALALEASCMFDHSLFTGATPPAGDGNMVTGDPRFKSTGNPNAEDFYRLRTDSPAIDQGSSTLAFDIDGDRRPAGAAPDIGADEVAP